MITSCEYSTRLVDYFILILRYQIMLLKTHQQDTSYEQRQELTEDYKSCYKKSTLPCSSEFPPQSLLIPYNTLGISHQSNWKLFL